MWEFAVALGIPAVGALYAFARHLHKKGICFTIMQNKINTLSDHDEGSNDLHQNLQKRMNIFEIRQSKNEIYLKLILDDMNIEYNP